jgi:hypothetical protein
MGLAALFSNIVSSAINVGEARAVVAEGYQEAISTMSGMIGNAGQQTVFNDYVQPAFAANLGPVEDGWEDVDIGDYMAFMGEIVEEGNQIMADAYDLAQEILSELEEAAEEASYEE